MIISTDLELKLNKGTQHKNVITKLKIHLKLT